MECNLRDMQVDDLPLVLEWRNSDDVRNNMYTYDEISVYDHQQWWDRESVNPTTRLLIAEINGTASGVVTFTQYTGVGGTASWAFYSGNGNVRGIGSLMEASALKYAFEKLKLRRLECEVLEFNYSVVLFHRKFGFKLEGIKRKAYQRKKDLFDIYILAILEVDWHIFVKAKTKAKANGVINQLPKVVTKDVIITDVMIQAFSKASGDSNSIHFDDIVAQSVGFEGRISHGMLVGSLFSSLFSQAPFGEGTIYLSQSLQFNKPILVNTEVEVKVRVLSHVGRKVTLQTMITACDSVCIDGEATILLPKAIA
jgi:UDP-4-amino-4,6-dideoxy-N-acetyl-beta-L-altrosamine N-acetyltransferase